jgi:hypothetical protein
MKHRGDFNMQPARALLLLALITIISPVSWSQDDCGDISGVSFICGPVNAEDLLQVPDSNWFLASAMLPDTAFYLVNTQTRTWQPPQISTAHDAGRYPLCPTPPDMAHLETHGLSIRATQNNHATLYAVAHGGRESIEVYDVDSSGRQPVLTWKGCILMPEGLDANSVASFADGSIVVTVLIMPGHDFMESVMMKPTGAVFKWSPGDSGFTQIANTELPGNNGIETSSDGSEIYVVSSGFQTIVTFTNTNPARQLRSTSQFPITPDNVHMGPNGKLLTAGMKNDVPECGGPPGPEHDLSRLGTCPRGTIALAIDPVTMEQEVILDTPTIPEFSNATMLLQTGDHYWLGTFNGNRIAHGTLP